MHQLTDRLLSELQFWPKIMREHAIFIEQNLPCDATLLIKGARDYQARFAALEKRCHHVSPTDLDRLAQEALDLTLEFIQYKTYLLDHKITCKLGGSLFPLFLDHMRREATRFAVNIVRYRRGMLLQPTEELLQTEIFWLRDMADHARFILHQLDPSERNLSNTAQTFAQTFDRLRCQAEDLESMLEITPRPIPTLVRFAGETLEAGHQIANFQAVFIQLTKDCKVLTITPPLLAEHATVEAERFLFEVQRDLQLLDTGIQPGPVLPEPYPIPGPVPGPCPGPVLPAPGPCPDPVFPAPGPCPGPVLPPPGSYPVPGPVSPLPPSLGLPCPPAAPPPVMPFPGPGSPFPGLPLTDPAASSPEAAMPSPGASSPHVTPASLVVPLPIPSDTVSEPAPVETAAEVSDSQKQETLQDSPDLAEENYLTACAKPSSLELSVPPQPLYRPQKTFLQPNTTQVKIQFK